MSFATASSTAFMSSVGSKRAATFPCRSTRNLVKFHLSCNSFCTVMESFMEPSEFVTEIPLHHVRAFLGRRNETRESCFQRVRRLVGIDTIVGHDAHVKSRVIDLVSGSRKNRGRHGHRAGQAVHIQCRIIAGGREYIRIIACVTVAESVLPTPEILSPTVFSCSPVAAIFCSAVAD